MLVGLVIICMTGCQSVNPTKVYLSQLKYEHQWEVLKKAIWEAKMQSDNQLKVIKQYAKSQNNSEASLQKIMKAELLKKEVIMLIGEIDKLCTSFEMGRHGRGMLTVEDFLNPKSHYLPDLLKAFDACALFLQQKLANYAPNTTSWSLRYLKQYPPNERKKAPSFQQFYFNDQGKYQVLIVLGTLELAVLQEDIAIQKNILKE